MFVFFKKQGAVDGILLVTPRVISVTVGSVPLKSHQVQVLPCLLLAVRSWASHFLGVFICKMGMPADLIVPKKRKSAPTNGDPKPPLPPDRPHFPYHTDDTVPRVRFPSPSHFPP